VSTSYEICRPLHGSELAEKNKPSDHHNLLKIKKVEPINKMYIDIEERKTHYVVRKPVSNCTKAETDCRTILKTLNPIFKETMKHVMEPLLIYSTCQTLPTPI
jgi:hypothetical protein